MARMPEPMGTPPPNDPFTWLPTVFIVLFIFIAGAAFGGIVLEKKHPNNCEIEQV